MADEADLLELEHRVWRALLEGDPAADEELLAADFLGVYPTGYAGRADHVSQLAAGPTVAHYELSEARVVDIAPDAAILTYHAAYRRVGSDAVEEMWVSSLWQHRDGRWVNTFSQDTPTGGPLV